MCLPILSHHAIDTVVLADMESPSEPGEVIPKESVEELPRKKKKFTGLKYKERRHETPTHTHQRSRSRSPRRHAEKRHRSRERRHDTDDREARTDRNRDRGSTQTSDNHRVTTESSSVTADRERHTRSGREKRNDRDAHTSSRRPVVASPATPAPAQEMILVTVNDRLGTKKQIPCLPTDTVKDFKAIVASMIGRRPHEILLKRQSERPFKDFLTLQDYGVSHGASLDLEVDTGD